MKITNTNTKEASTIARLAVSALAQFQDPARFDDRDFETILQTIVPCSDEALLCTSPAALANLRPVEKGETIDVISEFSAFQVSGALFQGACENRQALQFYVDGNSCVLTRNLDIALTEQRRNADAANRIMARLLGLPYLDMDAIAAAANQLTDVVRDYVLGAQPGSADVISSLPIATGFLNPMRWNIGQYEADLRAHTARISRAASLLLVDSATAERALNAFAWYSLSWVEHMFFERSGGYTSENPLYARELLNIEKQQAYAKWQAEQKKLYEAQFGAVNEKTKF